MLSITQSENYPKRKIIYSLIYLGLSYFVISYFYKVVFIALAIFVWREQIKERFKYFTYAFWSLLLLSLFLTMPRYRYNCDDRVRLIYQDEQFRPKNPPLYQYLINVFLPEEEGVNLAIKASALSAKTSIFTWVGERFQRQFKDDVNNGLMGNYTKPYEELKDLFENPASGFVPQFFNQFHLGKRQRAVYVISPNDYDPNRSYPVVFYCHGFLGNKKVMQGSLINLKNCIVLCPATRGWSGIFTKADIAELFTKQLGFLESLGYKVDRNKLHLIGLSNGESAANQAYQHFSKKLKSISFIACSPHQTYKVSSKINLIGGGIDAASKAQPYLSRKMKQNGNDVALFWKPEYNHMLLLHQTEEIYKLLNERLGLEVQEEN